MSTQQEFNPELDDTTRASRPVQTRVWDPLVRIFHWSLVGIIAYELIAKAGTDTHEFLGYTALALIAFRLIWGFVGSRHARFTDFVKSPIGVFTYLKSIVSGQPRRYLGHNPAGGAMVIALMAMVLAVGGSGWAMTTDALWGKEWIEELHEVLSNLMIVLIIAHVVGVIAASLQHKENLVRSMITGNKAE